MLPSERQTKMLEAMRGIYDILWEMEWFGNFGNRKEFIKNQIKSLKDILEELGR